MPAGINEDVRLPAGIMVHVRAAVATDKDAIAALLGATDSVRIGAPHEPSEAVLVARQRWTGELVGCAAWRRVGGTQAGAMVAVARAYARSPLAAHLLARLARLADEALVPTLTLAGLDVEEPAARIVAAVFDAGPGDVELRTDGWPEAVARARRIEGVPRPADGEAAADATPQDRRDVAAGVVVAGGGVAALECLMALRDLAGPDMPIRLLAPEDDFVYRPLQVGEPFGTSRARRYPLARIAADFDAELVHGAVAEVRPSAHELLTDAGAVVGYDALVIAAGARQEPAGAHAITFGAPGSFEAIRALLDGLDRKRIAFVAPGGTAWTLPLYELALMTAREARKRQARDVRLSVVSPEQRPLAVFGPTVSTQIGRLLEAAGVEFVGSSYATPQLGAVAVEPGGLASAADAVVTLPALRGPSIAGLPADADGFIPTDRHGRVDGVEDVYAAGDATTFPVKQGGVAAQQADAVAEAIAARFGAPVTPQPFKPVLRGLLYTGGDDRFLRAGIGGGEGDAEVSAGALWWPPGKVAGLYLAPYLMAQDERAPGAAEGYTDVSVPLGD